MFIEFFKAADSPTLMPKLPQGTPPAPSEIMPSISQPSKLGPIPVPPLPILNSKAMPPFLGDLYDRHVKPLMPPPMVNLPQPKTPSPWLSSAVRPAPIPPPLTAAQTAAQGDKPSVPDLPRNTLEEIRQMKPSGANVVRDGLPGQAPLDMNNTISGSIGEGRLNEMTRKLPNNSQTERQQKITDNTKGWANGRYFTTSDSFPTDYQLSQSDNNKKIPTYSSYVSRKLEPNIPDQSPKLQESNNLGNEMFDKSFPGVRRQKLLSSPLTSEEYYKKSSTWSIMNIAKEAAKIQYSRKGRTVKAHNVKDELEAAGKTPQNSDKAFPYPSGAKVAMINLTNLVFGR